jgi:formyl-CoA transferase
MLAVQNEREWQRLCTDVLERPEMASDPRFDRNERRFANRAELEPMIEEALSCLSLEEAEARLERSALAYSRLNEAADVLTHPQVEARDRLVEVAVPGGNVKVPRAPFNIEGLDEGPAAVPGLGEHTQEVLQQLGYRADEIASLRSEGAV